MTKYLTSVSIMIFLLLTIACGTNRNNSESPAAELTIVSGNVTGDIDSNALPADYELLFIGNSHSSFNGLPNLVAILIEAGEQGTTANAGLAPGWNFLSDRLNDGVTQQALEARAWTHVFLQAQKYSSTGLYSYSTEAAEEWIRRVKTKNALPIMFPEWPRIGNTEEGQRVYELHRSIALEEPACVAPVGPVWDEFILRYPAIGLHATDGNHSNLKGALLSAYVFYQIISGNPASGISYIAQIDVSEQVQEKLKEVASVFHNTHLPCA